MGRLGKKMLSVVALGMAVLAMSSCKRYLDVEPTSSFDADYAFDNAANARKAVLGAYASLAGDNGYGIRLSMYYPYDNDEMMGQAATPYPDNERRDIAHYNVQPSNTQLAAPFNQLYTGVERANVCIYYIPKMAQYNGADSSAARDLKRLHGEALTLRAQFYLELIRNWGDLPAQFEPSFAQTNLFKGKTDRDSIYEHLLDDLKLAETLVPWRTAAGTNDERITQGAVRALRARIALYRGGWSLRRSGVMERGSNYRDYYQIARDECYEIMQHSSDHKLNPSYKAVFKDALCSNTIEPNGEILWEVGFGGSGGTADSKLGYYNGPKYSSSAGGALTVLPSYFYMFDSTDARRDVTIAPYDINTDQTLKARDGYKLVDGKFRRDWSSPSILTSSAQYFGVNWPLIRFSDVLLMFAEADNELNGGPSADAIAAFEKVRIRAFGGNAALIGTTPSGYSSFFNAIVKERMLEFGGEGIRKYDLIRWNLIDTKLRETKITLDAMASRSGVWANYPSKMYYKSSAPLTLTWGTSFYQPDVATPPAGYTSVNWLTNAITNSILTYYAVAFKANHSELLPLPQAAIDANPMMLQQDYGY